MLEFFFSAITKLFILSKYLIAPIGRIVFKFIVLPIYGQHLRFRKKFTKNTSNPLDRFIIIFTNRYIVHLTIIIIALGVVTSNILAYETHEDYGKSALIYGITGLEDLDFGEDIVVSIDQTQVHSYLEESPQLVSNVFTEAQKKEEEIQELQEESDLAITQGGSALIKPNLASTEAAKVTRTSIKEYIVGDGDTIGNIAEEFNISVSTILWANNLSSLSLIKPSQKLIIPPTSGVVHTIKNGDTISSIAKKYLSTSEKIKKFNNITDSVLTIGETIMVPGGQVVTQRPRSYVTAPISAPAFTPPATSGSEEMIWPESCHRITQYYRGWRHTGLDIACGFGKPIYASMAGTVSKVLYNRYGYGYHVIIDHGSGKQTLYAHFSRIYVKVGQRVNQGDAIGSEGSTGYSTGSHLHFEVRINGSRLNPLNYVR